MLTDYMDLAEFRQYYQEFKTVPDANVEFYLQTAEPKVNPSVWKSHTKIGHSLWAAHLLAMSPFGMNLRLQNNAGITDYKIQFDELLNTVHLGAYVCNSRL